MAKQLTEKPIRNLIHEDLNGFQIPLQTINKIVELANNVAYNYEELKLGPFTYDTFNDIIENGILNVRVNYVDAINTDIKRLNITNPSIKHAMLGDIDRALKPFQTSLEALKKYTSNRMGYFSLKEKYKRASFKNGRFVVTDQDIEELKDEYCRIYVEDSKQESSLEKLHSFVTAYNELINSVSDMNPKLKSDMITNPLKLWEYISIENDIASVYNPNLSYFLLTDINK